MSFMAELLVGKHIEAVWADSEVTYIMLTDGTQITIRGMVAVQPGPTEARRHRRTPVADADHAADSTRA
jgi:hypothetical protein